MTVFSKVHICVATAAVVTCAGIFIYKRLTRILPAAAAFNLDINVVTKAEECKVLINELRRRSMAHGHKAIGFDCEWVSIKGHRQPVSLLQLANYDGFCVLIRLNQLHVMPPSLVQILEDTCIYKVGIAPLDDANHLYNDQGLQTMATIDLRHLADMCGHGTGGMAYLAEKLLRVALDKRLKIRCSNWEAETLSPQQLHYAASDAYAGIQIFVKLLNELDKSKRKEWSIDKGSVWDSLDDVCEKFTDFTFKNVTQRKKEGSKKWEEKIRKPYPFAARTKPLYDNCILQAPDGDALCTCDNKKALWYVEKGLADQISTDPLVVRLRFEPAGRSVGEVGKYYQMRKENRCVVCGDDNSYIRKNVVPKEYRRWLPEIMKDRSSHDVLLLCGRCHQRSNIRDQSLRRWLGSHTASPPHPPRALPPTDCRKVRNAARALLMHGKKHNLPEARREELKNIVLDYYTDHTELTDQLLQEACKLNDCEERVPDEESHGQAVVKHYLRQPGGLLALEELWRRHFLTTMMPKHMPTLWSLTHTEERLRVKWNEGRLSKEHLKLIGVEGW